MTTATAAAPPRRPAPKHGPYGAPVWDDARARWVLALTDAGRDLLEAELVRWHGDPMKVAWKLVEPYARILLYHGLHNDEDFKQLAYCGWLRAVYGYDPSRGLKLSTYAAKCIKSEFSRPVSDLGRAKRTGTTVSLNGPIDREDEELHHGLADHRRPDPAAASDPAELRAALAKLPPRDREILELRRGLGGNEPMLLRDIGRRYGLAHERIRQIDLEAVAKLRRLLDPRGEAA